MVAARSSDHRMQLLSQYQQRSTGSTGTHGGGGVSLTRLLYLRGRAGGWMG